MPYYGTDVGFTERDGTPIDGTMFVGMKDQTCIGDWCLNNIKSPPAWYSTASPVDLTGTYDCDPYSACLQEDTYYSVPGMLEECANTAKYMFFPNAEEQARRYFRLQGCDDVTIETETRDGVANIIPDCYNDGYMECDDKPKTYWYNVNFESVVWGGKADESSFMHYVGCFGYCESLLYPAIANMWGYFVGALSNYIVDPPERTFELNLAYNNGSEYPEVFDGTGPETEYWAGKNCDNGVNVEFYKLWGQESSFDKKSAGSYLPYNWTSHSELVFNFFEANPKTIACSADADCPSHYVCDGGARRKLSFSEPAARCSAIKNRKECKNAANKDTCSWSHHKKKCKGKRKACASLASKKKCHKTKYHNFCKWSHKKTKCRNVKCKEIDAKRDCKKGCEWENKQCRKKRSVDSGVCVQDF
jgi:hypothetical protein